MSEYIKIPLELLPTEIENFSFHLYLKYPSDAGYTHDYSAGHHFSPEKRARYLEHINAGGEVAISSSQKKTFLRSLDLLGNKDLPEELAKDDTALSTEKTLPPEGDSQAILEEKPEFESKFELNLEISKAIETDNFLPLILKTKEEVLEFSRKKNQTVSNAIYLSHFFLNADNITNRIVCISYFLAKTCSIKNENDLSELICAAFFHDLGITQLAKDIRNKAQEKAFQKHIGLTQHLIRKSGIQLSDRTMSLILQHHELADGSGYPLSKTEQGLDTLSLILGIVDHSFHFSRGDITGSPTPMKSVISMLKNKIPTPGLEFEFGATIYNSFIELMEEKNYLKKTG